MHALTHDTKDATVGFEGLARRGALGLVIVLSVMAVNLALAYGAFAANDTAKAATSDHKKLDGLAGRWSGSYYGYSAVRAKCGGRACTLIIDISPCQAGWCGVIVQEGGKCGGMGMTMIDAKKGGTYPKLEGHLTLDPKAAGYVIQATLLSNSKSDLRHLSIYGDTGKELSFMRRSFPFQAELTRVGDAVCAPEKATS